MPKKAYRSKRDCKIAGVCGGLAEYFNLDSTLIRIGMILLGFWGGVGVILYLLGWLLIPPNPEEESTGSFDRSEKARERVITTVRDVGEKIEESWKQRGHVAAAAGNKTLILGILVLLVGLLFLLSGMGLFDIQFSWSLRLGSMASRMIRSGFSFSANSTALFPSAAV